MRFENRDYELSPYTGLTREHWIQAGKELLEGIFRHVGDMDAPVIVARKEKKVTYPHLDAPENIRQAEYKAEMFEGLTRSFLLQHVQPRHSAGCISGAAAVNRIIWNMRVLMRTCRS